MGHANPKSSASARAASPGTAIEQLAVPFAEALAVFLAKLAESGVTLVSSQGGKPVVLPFSKDVLNAIAANLVEADEASARQGKLEVLRLDETPRKRVVADRLRRVAKEKGITQSELARTLGVTPPVISRVFKNPERSKVETLRRIADALGVELYDIV